MREKNESFFKDLDLAKEKSGSCSCVTFAILFALIFILVEVGIFYFFKAVKTRPADSSASHGGGQVVSDISKIDLGESQSQITITQGGLCQKIVQLEADKIESLSCVINPEGIELSGKLSSFLPANSTVVFKPKVENDTLKFDVKELMIGQVSAPRGLSSSLANSINNSLIKIYPELDKVSVLSVELQDGVMLIKVKSEKL